MSAHKLAALAIAGASALSGSWLNAQVLEISQAGEPIWHRAPLQAFDRARQSPRPPVLSTGANCEKSRNSAEAGLVGEAAYRTRIHPTLVLTLTCQESRFKPTARSLKGAYGLMQLMPSTAKALGVDSRIVSDNVAGGTRLLAQLLARYDGDIELTLAAYNAGPTAVDRYGGVPPFPETRRYVATIMGQMAEFAVSNMPKQEASSR